MRGAGSRGCCPPALPRARGSGAESGPPRHGTNVAKLSRRLSKNRESSALYVKPSSNSLTTIQMIYPETWIPHTPRARRLCVLQHLAANAGGQVPLGPHIC